MIVNLDEGATSTRTITAQVCIIGAGTAGVFLARRLADHGVKVVLLESGGRQPNTPESLGHHPEQIGIRYRGADLGRSFGLGGTSVLWGGQMIPVTPGDISSRAEAGFDAWPISYDEIQRHISVVKSLLGLPDISSDDEERLVSKKFGKLAKCCASFKLRLSQWLPFKTRNIAKAFAASLNDNLNVEVWINATAIRVELETSVDSPQIKSVEAVSPGGNRVVIDASVFVVCAGALESTRLLLDWNESSGGLLYQADAPLGRYFADHLSVTCGKFNCRNWRDFNLAVSPIFSGSIMRTPRLELSLNAQQSLGVASAFAHFTFVTHGSSGFDVVRSILRRRQGESVAIRLSPAIVIRTIRDFTAMFFYRFWHKRLWIPRDADLLLQIDIEQSSNPDSRLSLSGNRDHLGRKLLRIDWRIQDCDIRCIQVMHNQTIAAWQQSELSQTATLETTLPKDFSNFETLYDVYHPTGTIRMGANCETSVVDNNLKLWNLDNLYVSSTAVFPSAGSANPGLTHLALTSRLADHIAQQLLA